MKYWFLRHRNSGSKGWQALRGDQQRRWVLPWAQLPAPRLGTKRRIWGPFIGLWRWSWVLVESNQLEFTGQRSSDSYFQKRYGYQGGKESWGNWEVRTYLYTLLMLCVQSISYENLLYGIGNYCMLCGYLNEKEIQKRGDICICIANSLCH